MAGRALTDQSTLMCPHGGTVNVSAVNSCSIDGAKVLAQTDVSTVSGCSFQLPTAPSPTPSPCVIVVWSSAENADVINGIPALSDSSVGQCYAATGLVQGTVQVSNTQSKAQIG